MRKKEMVEIIEILMLVEKGGDAYHFEKQQPLKTIVLLANGKLLKLEKDFFMERRYISPEELSRLNPLN